MISKYRISIVVTLILLCMAAILAFRIPTQPNTAAQSKRAGVNSSVPSGAAPNPSRTNTVESRYFGDGVSVDNDFFYKSLVNIYRDYYVPEQTGSSRFGPARSQGAKAKTNKTRSTVQADRLPETSKKITIFNLLQKGAVDTKVDQAPQQRQITPDVVRMVGPVSQDLDLRDLPYMPPSPEKDDGRLMRHPPGMDITKGAGNRPISSDPAAAENVPA